MQRYTILISLICLLLWPLTGHTASTQYALWYKVYWSGLHVGDLVTEITTENDTTTMHTITRARGLAWAFSEFYSDSTSVATNRSGSYIPARFDTNFHLRKRGLRNILLEYDAEGKNLSRSYEPKENRDKREDVPQAERDHTLDPQTLALQLQKLANQFMLDCKESTTPQCVSETTLPLYDGRRRSNVKVSIPGVRSETINRKKYRLVHMVVRREPVSGYTDNELERIGNEEPDIHIYIPVGRDPFVPIKISAEAMLGSASALLEATCSTLAECKARMEED